MTNRTLLTPYFFDQYSPGLQVLIQPSWSINQGNLIGDTIQQKVVPLYQKIKHFTKETVLQQQCPVSIAGDCCAAIPVLAGLVEAGVKPVLVWLDAHGDFNTWETTPSGFLGGMPLAMLVGRGEQTLLRAVGLNPVPESDVVLSDGRDLDPGEREALSSSNVFHLQEIRKLPSLSRLNSRPLYIHFDSDIVDPIEMPAMNYPSRGGPSVKEVEEVFWNLAKTGRVIAISVSTWNPQLEGSDRSRVASFGLLSTLLGESS